METAKEWLLFIKGKKELYEKLEKAIKEIHPYETPEIIAMPIVAGSKDYLEWLKNELKKRVAACGTLRKLTLPRLRKYFKKDLIWSPYKDA